MDDREKSRAYMNAWYKRNALRLKEKRVSRALEAKRKKLAMLDTPEMAELRDYATRTTKDTPSPWAA